MVPRLFCRWDFFLRYPPLALIIIAFCFNLVICIHFEVTSHFISFINNIWILVTRSSHLFIIKSDLRPKSEFILRCTCMTKARRYLVCYLWNPPPIQKGYRRECAIWPWNLPILNRNPSIQEKHSENREFYPNR